jgi:hypothetical protein
VIQAFNPNQQRRGIEVQQQSGRVSADLEVSNHLRAEHGMKMLNGFDFYNDAIVDEKVQSEPATDTLALVLDDICRSLSTRSPSRLDSMNRHPG